MAGTFIFKSLNVYQLQGLLFEDAYTQSKEVFRDAPLMWLKELTGQLNSHLDQVPQSDPTFTGRAAGTLEKVNKGIQKCYKNRIVYT